MVKRTVQRTKMRVAKMMRIKLVEKSTVAAADGELLPSLEQDPLMVPKMKTAKIIAKKGPKIMMAVFRCVK